MKTTHIVLAVLLAALATVAFTRLAEPAGVSATAFEGLVHCMLILECITVIFIKLMLLGFVSLVVERTIF